MRNYVARAVADPGTYTHGMRNHVARAWADLARATGTRLAILRTIGAQEPLCGSRTVGARAAGHHPVYVGVHTTGVHKQQLHVCTACKSGLRNHVLRTLPSNCVIPFHTRPLGASPMLQASARQVRTAGAHAAPMSLWVQACVCAYMCSARRYTMQISE